MRTGAALLAVALLQVACSVITPSLSPPSTSPISQESLPPSATVDGDVWEPLSPELLGGSQLAPMVNLPSGLLAIGSAFRRQPSSSWSRPTLWQTTDGQSWRALADVPALAGEPDKWIETVNAAVRDGSGLIAVGGQVPADVSSANAEAWTSADGVAWSRADVEDPTGATMTAILRIGDRYLAIGTDGVSAHAGGGTGTGMWISTDGRRWARASRFPGALMRCIGAGGGRFVAVGMMSTFDAPAAPGDPFWTSKDGVNWEQGEADGARPESFEGISGLTWTGTLWIAVGGTDDRPVAWTSPDGRSWTAASVEMPGQPSPEFVRMSDVARIGAKLLAIGFEQDDLGTSALVWESSDGLSWHLVAMPALFNDVDLWQITVIGDRVFVGGEDATTGDPLIWRVVQGGSGS
jgi:hypothetical protein